ncbi:DUF4123 domain-containing protein [Enterobacteriaceae bacterium LUAb1]
MTTIYYDYSPQAVTQQKETLYQAIIQMQQETGHRLYLLTDPVLLLQRTDTPFVQALLNRHPAPVPLPHSTLQQGDYPWLLALNPASEDDLALLRESIDAALGELHPDLLSQNNGRGICGWITSDATQADLKKQLGHTAIQKQPDHTPILVRYHDPAVHNLLWSQLNEQQQRRMGGILSGWLFPDGDAQVIIRRFQPASVPHSTFFLGLSAEQCHFILTTCGVINRTLRHYRQQNLRERHCSEQQAASSITQALTRLAEHPALRHTADQERFAFLVLQYHPQIDRHPNVAELFEHSTFSDDVTWTMRTLTIPPETWQRYAHELNESPMREKHP